MSVAAAPSGRGRPRPGARRPGTRPARRRQTESRVRSSSTGLPRLSRAIPRASARDPVGRVPSRRSCLRRRAATIMRFAPRAIAFGNFAAARRHRCRGQRARAAAVFPPPPWKGGGREGGPAPGSAGVPPASREARTRMRAFGPPGRRDAGAPRQFADERDREDPRPGRRASGSTPLPTSPLPGGRREDGATRLPVRPSRAFPNRGPRPLPLPGGRVKTESQQRLPWG